VPYTGQSGRRESIIYGHTVSLGGSSADFALLITFLSPDEADWRAAGPVVDVNGDGFSVTSVVHVDGSPVATTYVGAQKIRFTPSVALMDTPGYHAVQVIDSVDDTIFSDIRYFGVRFPVPELDSVTPNFAYIYETSFSTVEGDFYFPSGTDVRIDGNDGPFIYGDQDTGTIGVPPIVLNVADDYELKMYNPAPGGGLSPGLPFSVRYRAPIIDSCTPPGTLPGSPSTAIAVYGRGFYPESVLTFDGNMLTTTYTPDVGEYGTLNAVIPAALLASGGIKDLVVSNPTAGGGGGASAAFPFYLEWPAPSLTTALVSGSSNVSQGAQGRILECVGTGYVGGGISSIEIDGVPMTTVFVSNTVVRCVLPLSVVDPVGIKSVRVLNPAPGGGLSAAQSITVVATPYTVATPVYLLDASRWNEAPGAWTLVSTMTPVIAIGTSPPTVTLSGTPSSTPMTIMIDIIAGGALGDATFSWSADGGVSWSAVIVTAASVVLGATGLTANFASGTYSANNFYESSARVSSAPSRESAGGIIDATKTANQATDTQRPGLLMRDSFLGNRPAIRTYQTNALMKTLAWSASQPQPLTVYIVGYLKSGAGNRYFFSQHTGVGPTQITAFADSSNSFLHFGLNRSFPPNGMTATGSRITGHVAWIELNSPTSRMAVDTMANLATQDVGTNTLLGLTLLNWTNGTLTAVDQTIGELIVYPGTHSAAQRNEICSYLALKWGLSWTP
jgi:hypothetical protein